MLSFTVSITLIQEHLNDFSLLFEDNKILYPHNLFGEFVIPFKKSLAPPPPKSNNYIRCEHIFPGSLFFVPEFLVPMHCNTNIKQPNLRPSDKLD